MKHGKSFRKLGRSSAHRWSMLRTMVSQLLMHQRIETTLPKAKELRRVADQVVTISKEGGLSARRKAAKIVRGIEATHMLFNVLAERYKDRDGGYTRILRTRRRDNDRAQMAYIEYIDRKDELRPARPPTAVYLPASARAVLASESRE